MKITAACLTCQKEFLHYPSHKAKYCGRDCVPVNLGNASRWKDKVPVEFSCVLCGKLFSVRPGRAKRGDVKYCSYHCHQVGEGRKAGVVMAAINRAKSKKKSYPKDSGRHIHRTVAEKKLGRALMPGEVVHHIDENKQNFAEDNLQVLISQADHARLHVAHMLAVRKPRKRNKIKVVCAFCTKEFFVFPHRLKSARYCSRGCHNQAQAKKVAL